MRSTVLNVGAILVITIGALNVVAQTQQFPISDFINAVPSTGGVLNWNEPVSGKYLYIDMFGKRAALFGLNLGTSFSGYVTIRDLGDGTERVTVLLYTRSAA